MPKLPRGVSGNEVVNALKRLGFSVVRITGSHVNMKRLLPSSGEIPVTVPLHPVLAPGTLKSILRQTQVELDELLENL